MGAAFGGLGKPEGVLGDLPFFQKEIEISPEGGKVALNRPFAQTPIAHFGEKVGGD